MISVAENFNSIDNLHLAYLKCRKGKRKAANTRGFEVNLYGELQHLAATIQNGTYQPSRSVCFYVKKPKLREIFAADFRDRVVHRLIVDILEPYYEKKFIYDSYACRVGKGTHKAVDRLKQFVRAGTKNANTPFYYLQLDIKGFFMRISQSVLYNILSREIKEELLLSIIQKVIFHRPSENFVFKGTIPPAGLLPPHKTLFHEDKERGIPIGNLTSQFFANVYLNELDQFVKRKLGVKHYIRYVDDFILLHKNPDQLLEWKSLILSFIEEHLKLELKDADIQPVSVYKGIDFLGYFVKPRYALVHRRVFRNFKKALSEVLPQKSASEGNYIRTNFLQEFDKWRQLQARLNSYIAHFKYANSFSVILSLQEKLNAFRSVVVHNNNYIKIPKRLNHFSRISGQVGYFIKKFPGTLLIFPMGKFYELYGDGVKEISQICGLKPYTRSGIVTAGVLKKSNYFIRSKKSQITLREICRTAKKNYIAYVIFKQSLEETEKIKLRLPIVSMELITPMQMDLNFKTK